MKCIVLLFVSVLLVAIVQASVVQREKRQAQDDPVALEDNEDRIGRRRPTRRRTVTTTTTTTTQRPRSTSLRPDGVIHQPLNCICASTPQFNPVCGTDGNTYANRQKLLCTKRCGYDVEMARMGTC